MKFFTHLIRFAMPGEPPKPPDYMYHGTNHYNAFEIADVGLLTHWPNYGTEDQMQWPDGTREKRSYFSHQPEVTKSFTPTEGKPVTLRVPFGKAQFRREPTGDYYARKPIQPEHIEYLHEDGSWRPITNLREPKNPTS